MGSSEVECQDVDSRFGNCFTFINKILLFRAQKSQLKWIETLQMIQDSNIEKDRNA